MKNYFFVLIIIAFTTQNRVKAQVQFVGLDNNASTFTTSAPPILPITYRVKATDPVTTPYTGCKFTWSGFSNTSSYTSTAIVSTGVSPTITINWNNVQGNGSFNVQVSGCENTDLNQILNYPIPIRYLGPAGAISMNSSSNSLLSCGVQTVTFSTPAITNATNYTWFTSNLSGWSIVSGQGTNSIVAFSTGTTGGTISFTATRSDAPSVVVGNNFSITRPPAVSNVFVDGDNFVCSGQTKTYFLTGTPTAGSTFVWSANGLNIVGSNTNSSVSTTLNGSGTGSVQVAISNTCGTDTRSKSMQLGQYTQSQMAISGPSTVCFNSNNNYFYAPFYSGATYQWTLSPSSSQSFASTNAFNLSSPSGSSNTLSVKISNDCGTPFVPAIKVITRIGCGFRIAYGPNPSKSVLTIQAVNDKELALSEPEIKEYKSLQPEFSYTLSSLAGMVFAEGKSTNYKAEIDVSKMPKGLYSLQTNDGTKLEKKQIQIDK